MQPIEGYLDAGAEEAWVMYPESRLIHQYQHSDRSLIRVYHEADTLDTAPLFPGLTIVAAELFKIDDL